MSETIESTDTETAAPATTCEPPIEFKRNRFGLYEHVNYVFNDDGTINWRKMVRPEFLVPNKDRTKETDVSKLEDKDLLILLGGLKELARLRGFTEVNHEVTASAPHFVSVKTTINWIGNYETDGEPRIFRSLADAHQGNTKGFSAAYLSAIAENRGFVRAVRNSLGINIVGTDEVGADVKDDTEGEATGQPTDILRRMLETNKISFERFKNKMIKERVPNAADWESINDVEPNQVFDVIGKVKDILEAAKAKK